MNNTYSHPMGVAERTRDGAIVGKIHRVRSGKVPTAKRNRQQYRVFCSAGRWGIVERALPILEAPADLYCLTCFPNAAQWVRP